MSRALLVRAVDTHRRLCGLQEHRSTLHPSFRHLSVTTQEHSDDEHAMSAVRLPEKPTPSIFAAVLMLFPCAFACVCISCTSFARPSLFAACTVAGSDAMKGSSSLSAARASPAPAPLSRTAMAAPRDGGGGGAGRARRVGMATVNGDCNTLHRGKVGCRRL